MENKKKSLASTGIQTHDLRLVSSCPGITFHTGFVSLQLISLPSLVAFIGGLQSGGPIRGLEIHNCSSATLPRAFLSNRVVVQWLHWKVWATRTFFRSNVSFFCSKSFSSVSDSFQFSLIAKNIFFVRERFLFNFSLQSSFACVTFASRLRHASMFCRKSPALSSLMSFLYSKMQLSREALFALVRVLILEVTSLCPDLSFCSRSGSV